MISLKIEINPVPKGRPRLGKYGRVYTPLKTSRFEKSLRSIARHQLFIKNQTGSLPGPLKLILNIVLIPPKRCKRKMPYCKPDLDNLVKAVCDALNGVLWVDDAQICEMHITKTYDWTAKIGRLEINVHSLI